MAREDRSSEVAKALREYVEEFNRYNQLMDKYLGKNLEKTWVITEESLQELTGTEEKVEEKRKKWVELLIDYERLTLFLTKNELRRKPEYLAAQVGRVRTRGKYGEFLFLFFQYARITVAGVYRSIIRQEENLFRDGLHYLPESGRRPCCSRPAGENGISRYQVAANLKTQTARGMARRVHYFQP